MAEILRRPGRIQVANVQDGTDVVPAAFLYDHPLDPGEDLRLCPTFLDALLGDKPLEASACFRGACPEYGHFDVVCPSGFWGFRHVIGVPQSLGNGHGATLDVPLVAGTTIDPAIPAGVSIDPDFSSLPRHIAALRNLDRDRPWEFFDSRRTLLDGLNDRNPALVYFYCHGGTDAGTAYIQVGPLTDGVITPAVFAGRNIRWGSQPLVFVNGCNTAAVGPETPLKLVKALVSDANAAGVIGSQVTVFEPLACVFAETLLHALLVEGEPVGVAVKAVRLALLKQGNPLGLVYTPFVSDEVRIPRTPVAFAAARSRQHA